MLIFAFWRNRGFASDRHRRATRARTRSTRTDPSPRRRPGLRSCARGLARGHRPEPRHAQLLRLGLRRGDVLGRRLVAQPGPAAPPRRLHHPTRAPGWRRSDPRIALGNRQSRFHLSRDSDLRKRALRNPRPRCRAPHDRKLLHALGREDEHRRCALGPRPRARRRSHVHHCGRQRPEGKPPKPHPIGAGGPRVLRPRRHARLGTGRTQRAVPQTSSRWRGRQTKAVRSASRSTSAAISSSAKRRRW